MIVDLSHPFDTAMPVYPGDPTPLFRQLADIGTEGFALSEVTTVLHAGTHIDAPRHMVAGGAGIAEIPGDRCIGRGVLIDARNRSLIDRDLLSDVDLHKGDIVLLMSGRSNLYRTPEYFQNVPEVTEAFARVLVSADVSMLGIDFPSPDRPPFLVHQMLLGNGILIIENLSNLELLSNIGCFEVIALPVRFAAEAALARVVARVISHNR